MISSWVDCYWTIVDYHLNFREKRIWEFVFTEACKTAVIQKLKICFQKLFKSFIFLDNFFIYKQTIDECWVYIWTQLQLQEKIRRERKTKFRISQLAPDIIAYLPDGEKPLPESLSKDGKPPRVYGKSLLKHGKSLLKDGKSLLKDNITLPNDGKPSPKDDKSMSSFQCHECFAHTKYSLTDCTDLIVECSNPSCAFLVCTIAGCFRAIRTYATIVHHQNKFHRAMSDPYKCHFCKEPKTRGTKNRRGQCSNCGIFWCLVGSCPFEYLMVDEISRHIAKDH